MSSLLTVFYSSKTEKWVQSSNVYDDLRNVDLLSSSKASSRHTSTISYMNPRETEISQVKRPAISLILPSPNKRITTLDTIVAIENKQQSSSVDSIERKNKDLVTTKNISLVIEEKDPSCIYWTCREIIQLIYVTLFACLIATFTFSLIFYAFDTFWFEQSIFNNSLWYYQNNDTNLTEFHYDTMNARHSVDYEDAY